jgi:hypothetical protein
MKRINKQTKHWFFEKKIEINKPLENMTKMRREKIQISKIRKEKGEIKQTPRKSRDSSEITLRTYMPINWKILKK